MMVLQLLFESMVFLIIWLVYILISFLIYYILYLIFLKKVEYISFQKHLWAILMIILLYVLFIDFLSLITWWWDFEHYLNPFFNYIIIPIPLIIFYFIIKKVFTKILKINNWKHRFSILLLLSTILPIIPLFVFLMVLFAWLSS
jgi:hypothetical protein